MDKAPYEPRLPNEPQTEYRASTRWYLQHYGPDVSKWPYDPEKHGFPPPPQAPAAPSTSTRIGNKSY